MPRCVLLGIALAAVLGGQTLEPHWVELGWSHPTTTATYRVYRAPGTCSGIPPYVFLGQPTPVTAKAYSDKPVSPGKYAYAVTAIVGGAESAISNCADAVVPPRAPTGVAVASPSTGAVLVTWADSVNPTGTTRSVYRAEGPCSGFPVFARVAQGITVNQYTDNVSTQGAKCYGVTATFNAIESKQSETSELTVTGLSPSGAATTIK